MAQVDLIMPKMGESIMEATILKWVKQVGDQIEADETVLEIATDKVDSEVPSPVSGTLVEVLYKENDVVEVGKPIAVIATGAAAAASAAGPMVAEKHSSNGHSAESVPTPAEPVSTTPVAQPEPVAEIPKGAGSRFYSPLVRTIAQKENISLVELERIPGSGAQGRVTKKDILGYIETRTQEIPAAPAVQQPAARTSIPASEPPVVATPAVSVDGNVEIIEMDRMRKLIADHMVNSKRTSPHVTSFVEVDVTNIVNWRNKAKKTFEDRYGEKITFTPIFIEAVVQAIHDFPMINASVDGNRIIRKKDINIGMAAALPSGNLIVPVIKKADMLSLVGLTKSVNDLANRARANQLKPDEIQDGTFTLTNVGTFGNVMGTPIINQPQVAIMATGAIRKKPAVVETEYGDLIAVRHMMFLSLSYDHRVVDGFLGGSFLRRVADYLEAFDPKRSL
ncbi:MAG: 2-oxo acid dehydrogenase subunit E2 [Lewinellaceae bacterium]|nr:2-oxo acid dehydrogenase subunit E2 [Lewinellaceae bacterium]